jgi:hypothetical protein
MWSHHGKKELLRMLDEKLRFEVQKKVNELMVKFAVARQ